MKHALLAAIALSFALAGCQNEPEEAPDITEAIPIDEEAVPADESEGIADQEVEPDGTPTMESGSNPPEMIAPPPGSKVQPAD